jgi:hypothetical protein
VLQLPRLVRRICYGRLVMWDTSEPFEQTRAHRHRHTDTGTRRCTGTHRDAPLRRPPAKVRPLWAEMNKASSRTYRPKGATKEYSHVRTHTPPPHTQLLLLAPLVQLAHWNGKDTIEGDEVAR